MKTNASTTRKTIAEYISSKQSNDKRIKERIFEMEDADNLQKF